MAGASVAGAGDVNGDGRADLLIGLEASAKDLEFAGSAYVVFGTRSPSDVDLAALGTRGFRVDGAWAGDGDRSVAGAGDQNGDRLADLLLGANISNNIREGSGSAYVVFGKANTAAVDLGAGSDNTAPKLVLGGPRAQRPLRQKSVSISASCNEPCALRATGTVRLLKTKKSLLLNTARAGLSVAGKTSLRLNLPTSTLASLTRALGRGEPASAIITVRATDRAGNSRTVRRTVRLLR